MIHSLNRNLRELRQLPYHQRSCRHQCTCCRVTGVQLAVRNNVTAFSCSRKPRLLYLTGREKSGNVGRKQKFDRNLVKVGEMKTPDKSIEKKLNPLVNNCVLLLSRVSYKIVSSAINLSEILFIICHFKVQMIVKFLGNKVGIILHPFLVGPLEQSATFTSGEIYRSRVEHRPKSPQTDL